MSIISECYKKAYNAEEQEESFQALPGEYFPLVIRHDTFSSVDAGNLLDERLSLYCRHHIITDAENIEGSKREISKMNPVAMEIKVHYFLAVYYSGKEECNIGRELSILNNIETDVNFSRNYLVSVIAVIDSEIKKDDPDLICFLNNIRGVNKNFSVHAFTYFKNVETRFNILIDSITASVIYCSHHLSRTEFSEKEQNARQAIENYKRTLDPAALNNLPELRWQSMSAFFSNKRLDFIAHVLGSIIKSGSIAVLSDNIVISEAAKINVRFGDFTVMNSLLNRTFYSIPCIGKNDLKLLDRNSFAGICGDMFGDEGYKTVELSFKATLASYRTNVSPGDDTVGQLLSRLAEYDHDELIAGVESGIKEYIGKIQEQIKNAEINYDNFIKNQYNRTEADLEDILNKYINCFLTREELNARLSYWKVMGMKVRDPRFRPQIEEAKQNIEEYRGIKKLLSSYRFSCRFGEIKTEDGGKRYTIRDIAGISRNREFIEYLQKAYAGCAAEAKDDIHIPERGHVFAYTPAGGISSETTVRGDFGAYQINGSLLFGAYWTFM